MTQHLTNAPAIISQLATQLDACAGWTGDDWYPRVDFASAVLPLAVLEESDSDSTSYAAGAIGLPSGTLKITLHYAQTSTDGAVETAGRTILAQLLAQQVGIVFRNGNCGLSGSYTTAEAATDTGTIAIVITLAYGLTA